MNKLLFGNPGLVVQPPATYSSLLITPVPLPW